MKNREKLSKSVVAQSGQASLNLYDSKLMDKPSIKDEYCVVCRRPATDHHHVVFKSRVHKSRHKEIPTLSLCGMGNTCGCHGKAHSGRLYFRWREGWEYLMLKEPTKRDKAEMMEGWNRL